jgi:hypothetical protein
VATEEIEHWLRREVERLRESAPQSVIRLLRLSQRVPTGEAGLGWLIELDAANGQPAFDDDRLAAVLRDLRLLGLQPTLLRASQRDDAPAWAQIHRGTD